MMRRWLLLFALFGLGVGVAGCQLDNLSQIEIIVDAGLCGDPRRESDAEVGCYNRHESSAIVSAANLDEYPLWNFDFLLPPYSAPGPPYSFHGIPFIPAFNWWRPALPIVTEVKAVDSCRGGADCSRWVGHISWYWSEPEPALAALAMYPHLSTMRVNCAVLPRPICDHPAGGYRDQVERAMRQAGYEYGRLPGAREQWGYLPRINALGLVSACTTGACQVHLGRLIAGACRDANRWRFDEDGDGAGNSCDNCAASRNPGQRDRDGDGRGDACDPCPDDPAADGADDFDGDGRIDCLDNCPDHLNAAQGDLDGDGLGDACDDDQDGDGLTVDAEEAQGTSDRRRDSDEDGAEDGEDSCPVHANEDQRDLDGDGEGDVCDCDMSPVDGRGDVCFVNDAVTGVQSGGRCARVEEGAAVCREASRGACDGRAWWPAHASKGEGFACVVQPLGDDPLGDGGPSLDAFFAEHVDPSGPGWQACLGPFEADGQPTPGPAQQWSRANGCGWFWTSDPAAAEEIDRHFAPPWQVAYRRPDGVEVVPGTPDWLDDALRRRFGEDYSRGAGPLPEPPVMPEGRTRQDHKRHDLRRRTLREKAARLGRNGFWWVLLPASLEAAKVGFVYQAFLESYFGYGSLGGHGPRMSRRDPCREYVPQWMYWVTDLEAMEEEEAPYQPPQFRSVGVRRRVLDHYWYSTVCALSPEERAALPPPNHRVSPEFREPHNECECLPPAGVEDKCYDTEVDASWSRIWDFHHQIADEARVMTADQAEAEGRYGCVPDFAGRGCYGGYREGERPPHDDTQGRGRFTVSFCMEPPDWAKAALTALRIERVPRLGEDYISGWTVWPDFANHQGGGPGGRLAYDQLVDLWITWPLIDRARSIFDLTVPESFMAALVALIELYHLTPPAERPPVAEMSNSVYAFLRRIGIEGVPPPIDPTPGINQNALPEDFLPHNPDFIYDLFISGSE